MRFLSKKQNAVSGYGAKNTELLIVRAFKSSIGGENHRHSPQVLKKINLFFSFFRGSGFPPGWRMNDLEKEVRC